MAVHVYGGVPPVACIASAGYVTDWLPLGSEEVTMLTAVEILMKYVKVATFGEGTRMRLSCGNSGSTPPLKK